MNTKGLFIPEEIDFEPGKDDEGWFKFTTSMRAAGQRSAGWEPTLSMQKEFPILEAV
ncbi:MAG: hypothetical protein ACR2LN_00275 [Candidatus Levyibacteriota bacterium]